MKKLTDAEKKEIIKNILGTADRKKQLGIEADLHCISKGDVKDILKADGVDLRIFCGGRHDKRRIEDEIIEEQAQEPVDEPDTTEQAESDEELAQQWADLSIPPEDIELDCKIITDVQDIPVEEQRITYKKPEILDGPPETKDEDDKELAEIKSKVDKLLQRRAELCAELDIIDTRLRKYTFFYEDLYDELTKAGVEI